MIDGTLGAIIEKEIERAIELHGEFNSPHEAHSVLKEELEELHDEISHLEKKFDGIWKAIRHRYFHTDGTTADLELMEGITERIVKEAIQLSAVIVQLKNQQRDNKWNKGGLK